MVLPVMTIDGFTGSFPVSVLEVDDPRLPVDVAVYAYSSYKHNDMNTSATPAVAFTAVLRNTQSRDVNASFMLNLPIGKFLFNHPRPSELVHSSHCTN